MTDYSEKGENMARLIDADELLEHAYRDKLDSRELIADMIKSAPTVKEIPINIPLSSIVKALELEDCGDCIDRQAVLDHKEIIYDDEGIGYQVVKVKYIYNLPSVNPQGKTGHWIKDGEPWGGHQGWRCSKCNSRYDIHQVYTKMPYNFCPNCGEKKMENED